MIQNRKHFSGSYPPEDVHFLLRRLQIVPTSLAERERAIQLGERHYSEMIGPEDRPSRQRVAIFRSCLEANGPRFARDILELARKLITSSPTSQLTLVSLARAGTPVGVLLRRVILEHTGWDEAAVSHYSISVIRDRGIDRVALRHILQRHPPKTVRFIDGWTGKGVIARELRNDLRTRFSSYRQINPGLWVPLDISGAAHTSASQQDYLIPSVLLGGTLSGLVSRSILPRTDLGRRCFHGCLELGHLRRYDISRWFIETMMEKIRVLPIPQVWSANTRTSAVLQEAAQTALEKLAQEFGVSDLNRIKVGLGETVRVLLRRLPHRILLRDPQNTDGALVHRLARSRGIEVETRPAMFYQAAAIIADGKNNK
jgi:hypothetical protein